MIWGVQMPPASDRPPEPSTLHRAFSIGGPLDWGDHPLSAAEIARLHGAKATRKSLRLLEEAVAIEPRITADFLASLPDAASPYQLARRVKSPESLARKIRDSAVKHRRVPLDDLLRYTVQAASPDDLVDSARGTVDQLTDRGWRVVYAMHSYTDGSRYKGLHAYLAAPGGARVEIQFHSAASARIKELTTPWYEIERSLRAATHDRDVARQKCVDLSATLSPPAGIEGLTALGGKDVTVKNYSDSRAHTPPPGRQDSQVDSRRAVGQSMTRRNGGMMR
ncbi:hypothetical protein [Kribbella sindirgiensis]|uniref:RelA/SpoT domain-containing protein n=1 Tax=Kribbella sindirgiensis TaxID=1124744 RepID=A0A4R0IY10_9ACTN|nr:hypothetical protein [Kribbella sindirgiensis]TCC33705.1 hypothetical protein E0H50_17335 [Kribbella sindirgiensis]